MSCEIKTTFHRKSLFCGSKYLYAQISTVMEASRHPPRDINEQPHFSDLQMCLTTQTDDR